MLDLTFQSMNVQIQKTFQSGEVESDLILKYFSTFKAYLDEPIVLHSQAAVFSDLALEIPFGQKFQKFFLCPSLVVGAKIVKCKLLYAQGNAKYLYLKVFSQLISIQYKSQDKYFYKNLYFAIDSCFIAKKKSKKLSF